MFVFELQHANEQRGEQRNDARATNTCYVCIVSSKSITFSFLSNSTFRQNKIASKIQSVLLALLGIDGFKSLQLSICSQRLETFLRNISASLSKTFATQKTTQIFFYHVGQ